MARAGLQAASLPMKVRSRSTGRHRRHRSGGPRDGALLPRFWGACALACLLLAASTSPAAALEFHVDQAIGNDARSAVQAQSPTTPWRTIAKALATVGTGNTIRVHSGTYAETLSSRVAGVTLLADGPERSVVVAPPAGASALDVKHHDVVVDGLVLRGGVHGIRAEGADGLVVRGCSAVAQSANGFTVIATQGVTLDGVVAVSSGSRGILLERTSRAYVRNALVYDAGEWGIGLENVPASGALPPVSTDNVIAFCTVAFSGGGRGGAIRVRNAIAEIRDSVLADNQPYGIRLDTIGSSLHHDLISGSDHPLSPGDYPVGAGMLAGDPLFVAPAGPDGARGGVDGFADDDFSLAQIAAGDGAQSPAVDAGSGDVAT
ncbi:right-handed parallel beta-helix repeat-containing protein, partial [Candidatus Binatia bacterium]|nr:right-handed parallel beta-helix repeat-containing protein [Candidatus Binatia bacterium]